MLENTFSCKSVGKENNEVYYTDLYSFKCGFNQAYIVEVECHPNDIYIIKFFQKNHRDSKHRYCLLNRPSIRKGSSGARNFLMILNTVTKTILDTYSNNKMASFGFMGAPTLKELNPKKNKNRINQDGTVIKTKRFNTYGTYVKRYFNPNKFEHIEIETSSCYFLRNKKNSKLTTKSIETFFTNYIINYC